MIWIHPARSLISGQHGGHWLQQLQRPWVIHKPLWEEYRQCYPQGYDFNKFSLRLQRHIKSKDLTLAIKHTPGDVMMLDFAGKKMSWTDPKTQAIHYAQLLASVIPYSHFCSNIALPSQRTHDFIHGINQAQLYMQGLPNKILEDRYGNASTILRP